MMPKCSFCRVLLLIFCLRLCASSKITVPLSSEVVRDLEVQTSYVDEVMEIMFSGLAWKSDKLMEAFTGFLHWSEHGIRVYIRDLLSSWMIAYFNVEENVFFTLYTKKSPDGEDFYFDQWHYYKNFDPSKETVFVTHGWRNSNGSDSCVKVKDAYLANRDVNVIVVDWSELSGLTYPLAAELTYDVGLYVARMMNHLKNQRISLVGHSLGAHVFGIAGYHARTRPLSVVGLDPAYPLFANVSYTRRISHESALRVEVIHTDGGMLGVWESMGHVDFYINGGKSQRACAGRNSRCSHGMAIEYFQESLYPGQQFVGIRCNTIPPVPGSCTCKVTERVGGSVRFEDTSGKYYLETNDRAPYAKDVYQMFRYFSLFCVNLKPKYINFVTGG